jgi:hypothetical protein
VDRVVGAKGIVAAVLAEADDSTSSISTVESRGGGHSYVKTSLILFVEAISAEHLHAAAGELLGPASLHAVGLEAQQNLQTFVAQITVTPLDLKPEVAT